MRDGGLSDSRSAHEAGRVGEEMRKPMRLKAWVTQARAAGLTVEEIARLARCSVSRVNWLIHEEAVKQVEVVYKEAVVANS